uniref:Glucosinolate transporter n=1 Tax=Phyllotreta armoraciae TaxID=1553667 RepID=A0A858Z6M7_9CUCU|nr:glucosinolate transporter [Phyllotreta armoraciae]
MVKKRYEISKFLNAIVRRKDNADNEKEIKKSEDKNLEELKTDCSDRRADTPFLYFTILTVLLLIMVGSSAMTWTSPALIQLKMNNTRVNPLGRPIKTIEISMLLGIPMMANLVGSSVLPMLSDILGRKKMLYMCGVGFLMSTIGTAFSNRIYLLLLFNSITFCIQGASYALIPMYLTEVCEDHNRAKFGCIMTLFMPLGQLLTYLDGSVLKIKYFTLINSVPLLPFLAFFLVAPESPVYSMAKGRREQCLKSLKRLRGNKTEMEIQKDLEKINLGMEVQENRKRESKFLTIFYTKEGRLGLVFATLPMLFQYLSGAPIIIGLLAPIFDETKTLSGNTIAIIVGCVKVSCFFFISTIVERTGRKPLLVISCAGASMSLLLLAVYFYLLSIDSPAIQQLKFLPLLAVVLFIILYSVGLGSLPLSIISELFPSNLRPLAISIVTTFTAAISAVYSFGYPLLAEHIGTHWCFFIFSCCSLIGAFVMYFILPETKGKSLIEIQKILKEY